LQQASLALGALGVGSVAWLASSSQYHQALAKSARRKLALLVGINTYPDRALDPGVAQDIALRGCLTDVELQRQLLIHRFGFEPMDVVTLTNQEATRAGILTAIDGHLVQQAHADDVVVLHFSGYGSQVRVSEVAEGTEAIHPAWVTVDSRLPSEESPLLRDLLEAEVADRLGALATANLTTVIDAGSQDTGYLRWGNSRVRSRPTVPVGRLPQGSTVDLATPWPGLLLRAADVGRLVLESPWEGFSSGVFTYALTQSLWEAPDPDAVPRVIMEHAGQRLQRWVGADQQPTISDRRPPRPGLSVYGPLLPMPSAEGVMLPASDDRPLSLWLGGVPPLVLRYLQPGSTLVADTASGDLTLRLESRTDLRAVAKSVDGASALGLGPLRVYEQVRLLPQTIDLVVALDSQLKRVERVDATSALAGIPFVASAPAGERVADCLFGRLPTGPMPPPTLTAALPGAAESLPKPKDRPPESSYGLFAPNRTLLPGTMLAKEEAVKTAVNRLTPYLQSLLALKLVRLTENQTASQLAAAVVLEAVQPKSKPLWVQTTGRNAPLLWPLSVRKAQKALAEPDPLLLPRESRIAYHLANGSGQALHLLWISFDSLGECSALMAPAPLASNEAGPESGTEAPQDLALLAPGEMVTFPSDGAGWAMPGTASWVEAHIIFSTQPLDRCLAVLNGNPPSLATGFRPVTQPLKLAQSLLQDLSAISPAGKPAPAADYYALHHDRWATLSLRYEVV
jgi:hypothetical protein